MFKWLKKKYDAVVNKLKTITWSVAFKRFLGVPLLAVVGYDVHVMVGAPSLGHFMALSIDLVIIAWWYEWLMSHNKTVFDIELLNKNKLTRAVMVLLFVAALPAILILIAVTWLLTEFIPDTFRDFKDMAKDMWEYIKTGDK
ncbi:hypothetical protein EHFPEHOM_00021 [Vibrio phage vB_Vc_SrVc9]|uniref:Uncharacterized protein n=2 Tax=Maculvirus TaxID=2731958 RepID=A0A7T7GT87_9CAUD|nr:hypothetical protein vBVcSrVc2_00021 [Vibrio phage vB_Vc_SrVc2]CAB3563592.1 hypothetical protein EHFPEHOM_00021 [Vibrio phage vB_Vc_SrVc9]